MNRPSQIPLLTQLGARAMRAMTRVAQGYDPVFLANLLHQLGPRELGRWGAEVTAIIEALEEQLDPASTQHLVAFSAFFNGCPFCSVGHMYSGNLELFAATGGLFPVDEREVHQLQTLTDDELLWELSQRLRADHSGTFERVARLYELKTSVCSPRTDLDRLMLRLVAAWDILTESTILCTIEDTASVDPPTPIAKQAELRKRYHAARGSAL